ncbi:MAG: hypothetical protein IKM98_01090, partial [Bacteroidales bacterium]|nr:hypothetical protein [Bacteroidales bacterium]
SLCQRGIIQMGFPVGSDEDHGGAHITMTDMTTLVHIGQLGFHLPYIGGADRPREGNHRYEQRGQKA